MIMSAQGDMVMVSGVEPGIKPFPPIERALAGNILAQLGDPRPGVGVKNGLPDIVWREVPEGKFLMGSDKKTDRLASDDEFPQHEVKLSTYWISRYPVTNAQYQAFVDDGGYTDKWRVCWQDGWEWKEKAKINGPRKFGGAFDAPNHPVVGVSWYEATAFCQWLTKKTHPLAPSLLRREGESSARPLFGEERALGGEFLIRLPTEAEWEKAARGTDGRRYPWGNEKIDPNRASYNKTGLGTTNAVGCFPGGTSPYGCEDMAGNVWEWCLDVWHDDYKDAPQDGKAWVEGKDIDKRLVRGGAYWDDPGDLRCADRYWDRRDVRDDVGGVRLVWAAFRQ